MLLVLGLRIDEKENTTNLTPYDYGSIMHHGKHAFGSWSIPTYEVWKRGLITITYNQYLYLHVFCGISKVDAKRTKFHIVIKIAEQTFL